MKPWMWAVVLQPAVVALYCAFVKGCRKAAGKLPNGAIKRVLLFRCERRHGGNRQPTQPRGRARHS